VQWIQEDVEVVYLKTLPLYVSEMRTGIVKATSRIADVPSSIQTGKNMYDIEYCLD
jgi:hypothetical protein